MVAAEEDLGQQGLQLGVHLQHDLYPLLLQACLQLGVQHDLCLQLGVHLQHDLYHNLCLEACLSL